MDANSRNRIFVRTIAHLTQICSRNQVLFSIEKQVDSFVQKNSDLVNDLDKRIDALDPIAYPSAVPLEYRWKRLVQDLNELNDKLYSFRASIKAKQLEVATHAISYDLWPLVLKLSCQIVDETGNVGTAIDDLGAIYLAFEKYKKLVPPSETNSNAAPEINKQGSSNATVIVVRQHTTENNNNERNND